MDPGPAVTRLVSLVHVDALNHGAEAARGQMLMASRRARLALARTFGTPAETASAWAASSKRP